MNIKLAALKYLKQLHYSVFPVNQDKKPLIKWEPYQKRLPTEEEINNWWNKFPNANIGIATGIISGIAVIDLDEVEKAKPVLQELISDSLVFPIVKTPSGGEHWYFTCTDGNIRNNVRIIPGADFRGNGGYVVAPPSVNGNGGAWKWTNNINPTNTHLPFLPLQYKEYLSINVLKGEYEGGKEVVDRNPVSTTVYKMFEKGRRDDDIFHVAHCLVKAHMPAQEISQVIEKIALSCNPPFDLKEIPIKIESAIKRAKVKKTVLSDEIESWVLSTTGIFLSTDVYRGLQLSTRDEHKNVSIILKRLLDKGVIEKFGDKNGSWRVIDKESQTIDWYNSQIKDLTIRWPFGIETMVLTMPKNIICVAGSPNSGKTAFLLNVVEMNMGDQMPINYFSSEMGAMEMRGRLEKFDFPLSKWRFNAKERSKNFDDVIDPDAINIIDYMELSDKFYLVGGMMKSIYDKLEKGIAIIALQKNPGASMARGGVGTLEKPRLYIAMDSGHIKIEKAKNWRNPEINPNGMMNDFKLVNGCKFLPTGWYKEEDIKEGGEKNGR